MLSVISSLIDLRLQPCFDKKKGLIMIKKLTTVFLLALAPLASYAGVNGNPTSGPCQLGAAQDLGKWPFEIEYVYVKPKWSADLSAADLLIRQAQYYSGKNSPFAKNQIPTELSFYSSKVSLRLQPYVTYSTTIDSRTCAQVVGAKLIITQDADIMLAKELASKNCVSKAALNQQLMHDKVIAEELKSLLDEKPKQNIKATIFTIYEKQGAAGRYAEDINKQLQNMEKTALAPIDAELQGMLKNARLRRVETRENFIELYKQCDGEFEKASALARPITNQKEEH